ncbi:MAG: PilZ domain-containing protein [Treponema sp.]|nr:PilZ domain-containing protein [Treponema sp.]
MAREHRTDERYEDFGRVEAEDLCSFPGILDDISMKGCKVHFPVPVSLDMENQYKLNISLAQQSAGPLRLICNPQWKKINDSETEIGFRFMRSPDTPRLASYIGAKQGEMKDDSIYSMIIGNKAVFVG